MIVHVHQTLKVIVYSISNTDFTGLISTFYRILHFYYLLLQLLYIYRERVSLNFFLMNFILFSIPVQVTYPGLTSQQIIQPDPLSDPSPFLIVLSEIIQRQTNPLPH